MQKWDLQKVGIMFKACCSLKQGHGIVLANLNCIFDSSLRELEFTNLFWSIEKFLYSIQN